MVSTGVLLTVWLTGAVMAPPVDDCRATGYAPSDAIVTSDIEMRNRVRLGMTRLEVDTILREDIGAAHVASNDPNDLTTELYVVNDRTSRGLFIMIYSTGVFRFTYGAHDRLVAMCSQFFNTGP
ncbi:hypothetical protein AEAC466_01640 [Asticcacaulis sp. AC466]|uniref:hypothetical protein n=1 Tax=Asticcacaulis sp. AC466 TaxID=1282362 RepID=UPI0003C3C3FE|nr:hypothetical protein [Asticcacaulis sp. AC466]ESQ85908.1 hypothetical protein AEAC466_01640 [Asticcacaulis sp. AC466]